MQQNIPRKKNNNTDFFNAIDKNKLLFFDDLVVKYAQNNKPFENMILFGGLCNLVRILSFNIIGCHINPELVPQNSFLFILPESNIEAIKCIYTEYIDWVCKIDIGEKEFIDIMINSSKKNYCFVINCRESRKKFWEKTKILFI